MTELLCVLGDAEAGVAPHTGAAVRVQCCWSCCTLPVMTELLCSLGDAGAAVVPHTGAVVRVRC